ncbi:MAG: hypothetical protein ACI9XO_000808 [Paraglaciecola sp.]
MEIIDSEDWNDNKEEGIQLQLSIRLNLKKEPPSTEAERGHPKNQILRKLKSVLGNRTLYLEERSKVRPFHCQKSGLKHVLSDF